MQTISALDAKNRFGQLIDAAQRGPVTVTKKGRPVTVMLSIEDFERMRGNTCNRLLNTIQRMHEEALDRGLTEGKLEKLLADED